MLSNKVVLALFNDAEDESNSSWLLTGVPSVIRVLAGPSLTVSLENLKKICIDPSLVIVTGRLYPARRPDLVTSLRRLFPTAEVLLLSSSADPFPPLQPLVSDMVRHLAINPVSPLNPADDETRSQFADAIKKLVGGESWKMFDYLRPGTAVQEHVVSSSAQKEELIARIEKLIEGDSPDLELLRQRGALLADEMLENAMYDAPQGADGTKLYRKGSQRAIAQRERIVFRFGFDGEVLAIEVADGWGSLSPDLVLEHLARNQEGREPDSEKGGRGLFIIWRILDHFHINITPGRETVVGGHLRASSPFDLETPKGFHISTSL